MKRLFAFISMLCLLAGCNSSNFTPMAEFIQDDTVRLEINGEKVFVYDQLNCQLSFNASKCEFRAHTDTMLDYFVVSLDAIPRTNSSKVTANISWSTVFGVRTRENITLDTKRIKGDVIWLSDESQHVAAVVRVLE